MFACFRLGTDVAASAGASVYFFVWLKRAAVFFRNIECDKRGKMR
ncbi:hypothetical protein B4113_3283 [Geobacillus sp. B4113_201601]|nr:hypothetical protein B4113_3283 [Geobacillus sp. B4113_201601]